MAAVVHDLRANLDQLPPQRGQRPMFYRLGQGERAQEVANVVGQGKQLKTYLVVAEAVVRKPRPGERFLAFLDPLFGGVALILELGHSLG